MDGAAAATSLGVLLQILFLDLLLSGDNALVIALACRRLPPEQARRAAWMGAAGAIAFRLVLTLMTSVLMKLPFLQLFSALPLLVIALNLMQDEGSEGDLLAPQATRGGVLAAAGIIIVSDATMSLDNVVALAAVSGGSFWLLAFGLVLTIPLIVFGSFGFARLMKVFPLLADAGAALLGWVAGGMIVGDPLFASWVKTQAPAVDIALPLACAVFVLAQGHLARWRDKAEGGRERKVVAAPRTPAARPASGFADENELKGNMLDDIHHVKHEEYLTKPAMESSGEVLAASRASVPPAAAAVPAAVVAPKAGAKAEADEGGDRWMILGLLALFVIFGLFLGVAVMLPD